MEAHWKTNRSKKTKFLFSNTRQMPQPNLLDNINKSYMQNRYTFEHDCVLSNCTCLFYKFTP